jgi:hypothetical protein
MGSSLESNADGAPPAAQAGERSAGLGINDLNGSDGRDQLETIMELMRVRMINIMPTELTRD